MDKQECLNITELLSVTWDKPIDQASLTVRAKGYWEYIGDLPYDAVKQTVKEMGLSGRRWIPRPGEVRIATMAKVSGEQLPPEPEEAWTLLQSIGQKIYSGTYDYEKPHPVLTTTIKRLGANATALTTNSDRAMFTSLYEKVREAYILERYGQNE
jgi:hypothetical protein|tara:strand:- start:2572 stop:3036 length:465 start_codon:yes stop_codon:yes gene_type:complete